MIDTLAYLFMKKKQNMVAKRAREGLLKILFYRRKINKNAIDKHKIREINSVEKLDKFLQKYKIDWVTPEDLIGEDFSSHLSLVPKNKRIWIQTSSGYSAIEKLKKDENLAQMIKKLKRKEVAYTQNDLDYVIKEVYWKGLKQLYADENILPTIGIFSRFCIYAGSGLYPLTSLVKLMKNFPVRILAYGEPLSKEQLVGYVFDAKKNKITGMIIPPSTLKEFGEIAIENQIVYENLKYIGTGGYKPTKDIIEIGHQIGAKIIIDAYSVQECMPLGCIASGTISSEDKKWRTSPGLMALENICHIRVVDKNGENVDENEEGEIRITSPFEGTCLIDYPVGDVGKVLDYTSTITYKNKEIKIPYPLLSYNIKRKGETHVRVGDHLISKELLEEILTPYVGYNFLMWPKSETKELTIFLPQVEIDELENISKKIKYIIHPTFYPLMKLVPVKKEKIVNLVFPHFHHKPHNIITHLPKELESELYAI